MNYIVNRIDLDVHDAGAQAWINVRQNETNRKICIALTESGEPFALSGDCNAVFAGTKPDATIFFNSCEINGNTIECVLTGQNLAQTGDLTCEIRLYGSNNTLICSPRFVVHVQENAVDDNAIESSDEFSELTQLISDARDATDAANASVITGASASVDTNIGTPGVDLTLTQEANGQSMDFAFHNLKGENGDPGVHVGDTAPTNPGISLWIDTDDNGASQVLSVMGTFASLAALQAAVTNPNNGDAYGVGAAAPYDIYRYDAASGEWINYGNYKGDTGEAGAAGNGVSSVTLVSTSGKNKTYRMAFTDGTHTDYIVKDGADGEVSSATLNDALAKKAPVITETVSSTAIATFSDGADDMPMQSVLVDIEPIQDLSNGDPSPTNICPITGHTGVNVTRTGKNLIDTSNITDYSKWSADIAPSGNMASGSSNRIYSLPALKSGVQYTISFGVTSASFPEYLYFGYHENGTATRVAYVATNSIVNQSISFTAIEGVTYCLRMGNTGSESTFNARIAKLSYIQVEPGSTATTYEPYITPTTVSLSWQNEAGTVYGGTIDVVTGLLTVDRAMQSISDLTFIYQQSYSRFYTSKLQGIIDTSKKGNVTCEALKTSETGDYIINVADSGNVFINGISYTSVSELNQAIGTALFCYPLATPITVQLTPQQITTLLGTNNVRADTGDVAVTYPADTKLYIEKLTQPTEDDLVANQAITSGQYFMIGNSLYLALANIASGAAITIGTNAQRVSLADALNAINS